MTAEVRATTQEHLDIEDIRDDFVVLKDGGVLAILETTAVNFDLLSEREQDAMIEAYGGFLNSLSFPIQIVVRSKRLDISSYLALLRREKEQQENKMLRGYIERYHQFVKELIVKNQVLDKSFYVIISHREVALTFENPVGKLLRKLRGQSAEKLVISAAELVEKAVPKLEPKVEHVEKQLARIGIHSKRLNSEQLVDLFYELYNGQAEI